MSVYVFMCSVCGWLVGGLGLVCGRACIWRAACVSAVSGVSSIFRFPVRTLKNVI